MLYFLAAMSEHSIMNAESIHGQESRCTLERISLKKAGFVKRMEFLKRRRDKGIILNLFRLFEKTYMTND